MARGPSTLSTRMAPSERQALCGGGASPSSVRRGQMSLSGSGEAGQLGADDRRPFASRAPWWRSRGHARWGRAWTLHRRRWRARSLPRTASVSLSGTVPRPLRWMAGSPACFRPDSILHHASGRELFYRADEGQDGENRERADGDACLVRPRAPHFALARAAWCDAGPVSGLAFRDHAAADDGEGGAAALRLLPAPLA